MAQAKSLQAIVFSLVVPGAGVEPARPFGLGILSPLCLPFHHPGILDFRNRLRSHRATPLHGIQATGTTPGRLRLRGRLPGGAPVAPDANASRPLWQRRLWTRKLWTRTHRPWTKMWRWILLEGRWAAPVDFPLSRKRLCWWSVPERVRGGGARLAGRAVWREETRWRSMSTTWGSSGAGPPGSP
jgi:hypothetical protein